MDKRIKYNTLGIVAVLFSIGVIVSFILIRWVRYWIYYKPAYAIFDNSLYLPFHLYIAGFLLFFIIFLSMTIFAWTNRSGLNIFYKIIISLVTIGYLFIGKDIYSDIIFIKKDKFLTIECDINSLRETRHGKHRDYKISCLKNMDGNRIDIEMDFYQYNELKKEQEGNNQIIVVYYLPNTERMLKYELMEIFPFPRATRR